MGQGLFLKSTTPLPELRIVNQVWVVKFPKCAAWQDCLTAGSQVAMSTGRDPIGVYIYSSPSSLNSSFLKELFIYLTVVFVAAPGPSLDVVSRGYSSLQCMGFSLRWLLLLWSLSSEAQAQYLWPMVWVATQHEGSSQTRDQTGVRCIARQILNHWTMREAPVWVALTYG